MRTKSEKGGWGAVGMAARADGPHKGEEGLRRAAEEMGVVVEFERNSSGEVQRRTTHFFLRIRESVCPSVFCSEI